MTKKYNIQTAVIFLSFFTIYTNASAIDISASRNIINYEIQDNNIISYKYTTSEITNKEIISPTTEKVGVNRLKIYTNEQFYNDKGIWKQIEYATTTIKNFITPSPALLNFLIIKHAYAYFPSTDGRFWRTGTNLTWNDIDTGAGTGSDYTETGNQSPYLISGTSAWSYNIKNRLDFDTSAIPDGDEVSACSVNLYAEGKGNTLGVDLTLQLFGGDGTYENTGTTVLSDTIAQSAITTSAYNTFTCNNDGLNNVSKTGTTYFVVSYPRSEPVGYNNSSGIYVSSSWSETEGTSQDPYLDVTYSAPTPTPTPTATSTTATSTLEQIDNPAITLFLGIILFIFGFIITIYIIFK